MARQNLRYETPEKPFLFEESKHIARGQDIYLVHPIIAGNKTGYDVLMRDAFSGIFYHLACGQPGLSRDRALGFFKEINSEEDFDDAQKEYLSSLRIQ